LGALRFVLTSIVCTCRPGPLALALALALAMTITITITRPRLLVRQEYLMIAQQRTGMSMIDALKTNVSALGAKTIFRGLGATMSREAIYAASYMGGVPILREEFNQIAEIREVPGAAFLASGLVAGTLATVLTHPSDTIKTRQQAFPDLKTHPQYRTVLSTARHVVGEGGVGALFAGLLPRAFRIIGAMFIFNEVKTRGMAFLEGPDEE